MCGSDVENKRSSQPAPSGVFDVSCLAPANVLFYRDTASVCVKRRYFAWDTSSVALGGCG